jgi:hypothetical protein
MAYFWHSMAMPILPGCPNSDYLQQIKPRSSDYIFIALCNEGHQNRWALQLGKWFHITRQKWSSGRVITVLLESQLDKTAFLIPVEDIFQTNTIVTTSIFKWEKGSVWCHALFRNKCFEKIFNQNIVFPLLFLYSSLHFLILVSSTASC